MVYDVNGLELGKGDTVAPLTGDFKGRICAIRKEDGAGFVCVRAAHRPYSKGVWYAAAHVQRLQIAKVKPEPGASPTPAEKSAALKSKMQKTARSA